MAGIIRAGLTFPMNSPMKYNSSGEIDIIELGKVKDDKSASHIPNM